MWSQQIAAEIASILGYADARVQRAEGILLAFEGVVGELAEAFRYLPADKIRWTHDFARFLCNQSAPEKTEPAWGNWAANKLREVRDFALFLKGRYGYAEPADESDEWTEEDRRDFTRASLERLTWQ